MLSEVEAREALAPYLDQLQACLRNAWQRWQDGHTLAPDLWRPLRARTRACFLYDHICREVKERFEGVSGVTISEDRGFLLVNFRDLLLVRFKKLDRSRRSRNVPTRQQIEFGAQLPMPGIPPLTRATVGYVLNYMETAISNCWVTCPMGPRLAWAFELAADEPMVRVTSITTTPPLDDGTATHRPARVKPKAPFGESPAAPQVSAGEGTA